MTRLRDPERRRYVADVAALVIAGLTGRHLGTSFVSDVLLAVSSAVPLLVALRLLLDVPVRSGPWPQDDPERSGGGLAARCDVCHSPPGQSAEQEVP